MKKRFKTIAKIIIPLVLLATVMSCAPSATTPKGWSGAVIKDNTLFAGSMNGKLVSVDISSGVSQFSWALPLPATGGVGFGCGAPEAGIAIYSTPAVGTNLVYVGGYVQSGNKAQGKVYAYIGGQSEPRWRYPGEGYLEGPIVGGLVVSQGKIYFGAADGKVYAIDETDGHKIAEFQTEDKIWATPFIDGDVLYIGSFDKKLYVLDTTTLKPVKWQSFETEGAIVATPLVDKGTVYIGSYDRNFYAIDAATGNLKWKFHADKPFWAKPIALNDVIYAPALDNKVYILNAATGAEVVPAIDLGSPIPSSPVLVNNKVVIASQEGKIYFLNPVDNKLEGEPITLGEGVRIFASLSASGNVVYIHTETDSIYFLDVNSRTTTRNLSLKQF